MSERIRAYAVSVAVIAAVLWPLAWERGRDSFPLSPYPMFAKPLPDPRVTQDYALGLEADGTRHFLAPEMVGTEEVLQAAATIRRAVRGGRAARLCDEIAARVAGDDERIVEIVVVRGTHDAVDYLTGRDRAGVEDEHARCAVRRAP